MDSSKYRPEIKKIILNNSDDLIRFISNLVKTPSVKNVNTEKAVTELIAKESKRLGLNSKIFYLEKDRPNIFVGKDFSSDKGLLFIAHLDTVDFGDLSKWKMDPLSGKVKGGKLFGRGAIDCKSGAALSIYALKILKELGFENYGKFVGVVDEEISPNSEIGARYVLDRGLSAASAIYTYFGTGNITIGHRGLANVEIEIFGETTHTGSKSWQDKVKGASAVEAFVQLMNKINSIAPKGSHKSFPGYRFVQTVTSVVSESETGRVPDYLKLTMNIRYLPNQDTKDYFRKLEELLDTLKNDKIRFKMTVKSNVPGAAISAREPIVKVLEKMSTEILKEKPFVSGSGPCSEGYMFINSGIPTICGFGAVGEGAHSPNEYILLESIPKVLEIYVRTAIELA